MCNDWGINKKYTINGLLQFHFQDFFIFVLLIAKGIHGPKGLIYYVLSLFKCAYNLSRDLFTLYK